ncbi:MAG TPA: barstar family protein [Polyangiaceae bacterium]|nr:barstar family protein [Polyangiaceae bacterium]
MAAFTDDPSEFQRLDWRLLQNGAVVLYLRPDVLEPDIAWLQEYAYEVKRFDCRTWSDQRAMHVAMATTLSFPEYYGMNLNAMSDCISDLEIPVEGGLVLVFSGFDSFSSRYGHVAQGVLDLLADNARRFLLFGRRLLVLVQSDDPRIAFAPVGATAVSWNPKEWLNKSRGL